LELQCLRFLAERRLLDDENRLAGGAPGELAEQVVTDAQNLLTAGAMDEERHRVISDSLKQQCGFRDRGEQ
jgi:hypothetical protein